MSVLKYQIDGDIDPQTIMSIAKYMFQWIPKGMNVEIISSISAEKLLSMVQITPSQTATAGPSPEAPPANSSVASTVNQGTETSSHTSD